MPFSCRTSWLVNSFIWIFLSVAMITLLLCVPLPVQDHVSIITKSNPVIILLFFIVYLITTISFCFMMSTFFNRVSHNSKNGLNANQTSWHLSSFCLIVLLIKTKIVLLEGQPCWSIILDCLLCNFPAVFLREPKLSVSTTKFENIYLL